MDVGAASDRVDAQGTAWKADQAYASGGYGAVDSSPFYHSIGSVDLAADPSLYQSFRQGPDLEYWVDLPNGDYQLILHFAEFVAQSSGQRTQQLSLQGSDVGSPIDVYALAQGARALRLTQSLTVSSGRLDLKLHGVVGKAQLAAFEVLGQVAPTPTSTITPITDPLSLQMFEPVGIKLVPTP